MNELPNCGSKALTPIISLGEQVLALVFVLENAPVDLPTQKVPLDLIRCDSHLDEHACGLVQLRHSYPQELIYGDYWYMSGINSTMKDALASTGQAVRIIWRRRHYFGHWMQ